MNFFYIFFWYTTDKSRYARITMGTALIEKISRRTRERNKKINRCWLSFHDMDLNFMENSRRSEISR